MEFEKNMKRLEEIVTQMEKGDLALDVSLKLFEEGVKLSRTCQSELTQAEAHVQKLMGAQAGGQIDLAPFDQKNKESGE